MRLGNKCTWLTLATLGSVLVFLLAGCGSTATNSPAKVPDSQQILNWADPIGSTDISTMDPALVQDLYSEQMQEMVYPTLLVLHYDTSSGQFSLVPWAATAMPAQAADGSSLTFHLRPNLKWSDGTPIDAADFAYSLNRVEDPCTKAHVPSFLYWIKGAQAFNSNACDATAGALNPTDSQSLVGTSIIVTDPQTLTIDLQAPYQYASATLVTTEGMAVPQSLINQYGLTNWTQHLTDGSGFGGNLFNVTSWNHTGTMDLTRNPNYDMPGAAPILKHVNVSFFKDGETSYKAYQDGQANVEFGVPPEDYASVHTTAAFKQTPALNLGYLQPVWTSKPFDNVTARQAFALALNKTLLATTVCQGTCFASNHLIPEGNLGYNANLNGPDGTQGLSGNLTMAQSDMQQYVTAACGGTIASCAPIQLTTFQDATDQKLATAILGEWQAAFPGYTMSIQTTTFPALLPRLIGPASSRPQIYTIGYSVDYPDPQDWTSLQFLPSSAQDSGFVNDATANADMTRADTDTNATERTQLYQQAEQELVTQVAWITLDQGYFQWLQTSKVQGYTGNPAGYWLPENMQTTYISA